MVAFFAAIALVFVFALTNAHRRPPDICERPPEEVGGAVVVEETAGSALVEEIPVDEARRNYAKELSNPQEVTFSGVAVGFGDQTSDLYVRQPGTFAGIPVSRYSNRFGAFAGVQASWRDNVHVRVGQLREFTTGTTFTNISAAAELTFPLERNEEVLAELVLADALDVEYRDLHDNADLLVAARYNALLPTWARLQDEAESLPVDYPNERDEAVLQIRSATAFAKAVLRKAPERFHHLDIQSPFPVNEFIDACRPEDAGDVRRARAELKKFREDGMTVSIFSDVNKNFPTDRSTENYEAAVGVLIPFKPNRTKQAEKAVLEENLERAVQKAGEIKDRLPDLLDDRLLRIQLAKKSVIIARNDLERARVMYRYGKIKGDEVVKAIANRVRAEDVLVKEELDFFRFIIYTAGYFSIPREKLPQFLATPI